MLDSKDGEDKDPQDPLDKLTRVSHATYDGRYQLEALLCRV